MHYHQPASFSGAWHVLLLWVKPAWRCVTSDMEASGGGLLHQSKIVSYVNCSGCNLMLPGFIVQRVAWSDTHIMCWKTLH